MSCGATAVAAVARRALPGPPVPASARVALHFHPDVDLGGQPVLERIMEAGAYLSQFATGTSNGGLTAVRGGDRWRWEHRIFAGAYDDAGPTGRPVYGALMVDDDPYGPAPRFGSAYLRLRVDVVARTTFAYPDSSLEPSSFGVAERMGLVELWRADRAREPLDHYIEAHVHGGVGVGADVEALVLDPSHRESGLEELAGSAGLPVEWHPGYVLRADRRHELAAYRGAVVADRMSELAREGAVTPARLGRARVDSPRDPQLQKRLWHCLARFGRTDEPSRAQR